ncbi:MAG: hypothetical protein ACFFAN_06175 [Promethearchaeota archaeon]
MSKKCPKCGIRMIKSKENRFLEKVEVFLCPKCGNREERFFNSPLFSWTCRG